MNSLALICLTVGIIILIVRGGLAFAPETTLEYYQKVIATNTRIRIMGIIIAAISIPMIKAAGNAEGVVAMIILGFGWLLAIVSLFIIIFANSYRKIAEMFIQQEVIDVRDIGLFGVIFGLIFICFGLWLLL